MAPWTTKLQQPETLFFIIYSTHHSTQILIFGGRVGEICHSILLLDR